MLYSNRSGGNYNCFDHRFRYFQYNHYGAIIPVFYLDPTVSSQQSIARTEYPENEHHRLPVFPVKLCLYTSYTPSFPVYSSELESADCGGEYSSAGTEHPHPTVSSKAAKTAPHEIEATINYRKVYLSSV